MKSKSLVQKSNLSAASSRAKAADDDMNKIMGGAGSTNNRPVVPREALPVEKSQVEDTETKTDTQRQSQSQSESESLSNAEAGTAVGDTTYTDETMMDSTSSEHENGKSPATKPPGMPESDWIKSQRPAQAPGMPSSDYQKQVEAWEKSHEGREQEVDGNRANPDPRPVQAPGMPSSDYQKQVEAWEKRHEDKENKTESSVESSVDGNRSISEILAPGISITSPENNENIVDASVDNDMAEARFNDAVSDLGIAELINTRDSALLDAGVDISK